MLNRMTNFITIIDVPGFELEIIILLGVFNRYNEKKKTKNSMNNIDENMLVGSTFFPMHFFHYSGIIYKRYVLITFWRPVIWYCSFKKKFQSKLIRKHTRVGIL